MKLQWKELTVISLKLDDEVFTLAQMLASPYMRFFEVFSRVDGSWPPDLSAVSPLFCVAVGKIVIQRLGVRRIPTTEVSPSTQPFERYFIDCIDNSEGYRLRGEYMWRGGRLVDLGATGEFDGWRAPTIIKNLTLKEHKAEILGHEFCNVYGDNHIRDRLLTFHRTGINEDPMKALVFPDLLNHQ